MGTLTPDDVKGLLEDRSASGRAAIGGKIAGAFAADTLSDGERKIAESIFRLLARDVEVVVRRTLSEKLHACARLPHDVACTLAQDVIEVAQPVLRNAVVLTDADLLDIIHTQGEEHQVAIAGRARVSEFVADVLAGTKSPAVVSALVTNPGASIAERTYERIINDAGSTPEIQEVLVERAHLPPRIVKRLIEVVSDGLKARLAANHDLPPELTESLILETREQAVEQLLGTRPRDRDVVRLVRDLARRDRLSPALVLRALEVGDHEFFEHAIAARAGIPPENAGRLLREGGEDGILALYKQARLPDEQYSVAHLRIVGAYGPKRSASRPLVDDDFIAFYDRGWVESEKD
jgi:uncharacterized protein (DUF2336 family)